LRDIQQREEERARAESASVAMYEMVRQNKKADMIRTFEAADKDMLSKTELRVFSDAAEQARNDLSIEAYQTGLEHARTGRWHDAHQSFADSLRFKSTAAHSPAALFHQSQALRKLGRQREAIPILMNLSEASADKEYQDDAAFLLSQCLVDIQAWNDAKTAMRSFLRRFPTSPMANDIRIQLAELNLKH